MSMVGRETMRSSDSEETRLDAKAPNITGLWVETLFLAGSGEGVSHKESVSPILLALLCIYGCSRFGPTFCFVSVGGVDGRKKSSMCLEVLGEQQRGSFYYRICFLYLEKNNDSALDYFCAVMMFLAWCDGNTWYSGYASVHKERFYNHFV